MEANKVDDNNENSHSVDCEWVRLLAEAKELGHYKRGNSGIFTNK